MSLVLEILGTAITTCGGTIGVFALKNKLFPKKPSRRLDEHGALPWLYENSAAHGWGFRCPKCINIVKNKAQPPICECEEYPDFHFHFKCGDCGFRSLMRTADK